MVSYREFVDAGYQREKHHPLTYVVLDHDRLLARWDLISSTKPSRRPRALQNVSRALRSSSDNIATTLVGESTSAGLVEMTTIPVVVDKWIGLNYLQKTALAGEKTVRLLSGQHATEDSPSNREANDTLTPGDLETLADEGILFRFQGAFAAARNGSIIDRYRYSGWGRELIDGLTKLRFTAEQLASQQTPYSVRRFETSEEQRQKFDEKKLSTWEKYKRRGVITSSDYAQIMALNAAANAAVHNEPFKNDRLSAVLLDHWVIDYTCRVAGLHRLEKSANHYAIYPDIYGSLSSYRLHRAIFDVARVAADEPKFLDVGEGNFNAETIMYAAVELLGFVEEQKPRMTKADKEFCNVMTNWRKQCPPRDATEQIVQHPVKVKPRDYSLGDAIRAATYVVGMLQHAVFIPHDPTFDAIADKGDVNLYLFVDPPKYDERLFSDEYIEDRIISRSSRFKTGGSRLSWEICSAVARPILDSKGLRS